MFQIVHCVLDDKKEVLARRPLEPLFELWQDAAAMAEFDSSRLWDEYGYDEERSCWWSKDSRGRIFRFEVEKVTAVEKGPRRNDAPDDAAELFFCRLILPADES